MAAVTVTARTNRNNVAGARLYREWRITGNDTNTIDTGLTSVRQIFVEPCSITAVARSTVNGKIRLTFSASGAFTDISLLVSK